MTNCLLAAGLVAAGLLAIGGCGRSDIGPTGTVSGKITCHGQPVTEGRVVFVSSQGQGASGLLTAEGQYTLRTIQGTRIPVGEYQVVVQPPPPGPPSAVADPAEALKTPGKRRSGAPGDPVIKEYPNIPAKYRNPDSSDWKVTVKEGPNSFDFNMER